MPVLPPSCKLSGWGGGESGTWWKEGKRGTWETWEKQRGWGRRDGSGSNGTVLNPIPTTSSISVSIFSLDLHQWNSQGNPSYEEISMTFLHHKMQYIFYFGGGGEFSLDWAVSTECGCASPDHCQVAQPCNFTAIDVHWSVVHFQIKFRMLAITFKAVSGLESGSLKNHLPLH